MFKNTLFMGLTTAAKMLSGIVVFVVMARVLGPHGFGVVTYTFTLASLFVLIVDYGFVQQLLRDVGANPQAVNQHVGRILLTKGVLTIITILICIIYFQVSPKDLQTQMIFWVLFMSTIISSFCEFLNASFRGVGKYKQETNIATIGALLHFFVLIIAMFMVPTTMSVAIGFLISKLFYLVISWVAFVKYIGQIEFELSMRGMMKSLSKGFPYAADAGLTNFFQQIDTILVHNFLGVSNVGLYQAVTKWLQGFLQFAPVLANVYLPSIASATLSDKEKQRVIKLLMSQMLILGIFGCVFFNYYANYITDYIYGEKYKSINNIWSSIGFLLLFRYIAASIGVVLTGLGHQKIRVYAQIGGLLSLLVTVNFFINLYSLKGIVFSQISSVVVLICIYLYYAFKLKVKLI